MREKSLSVSLGAGMLAGLASLFTGIAGLSACCIGPLALLSFGAGSSMAATLEVLQPWQPLFISIAVVTVLLSGWRLYRPQSCTDSQASSCLPDARRKTRWLFWLISLLVLLSISAPFISPYMN